MRKTKIVCTIGPATEKVETLRKLVQGGMNVARLNFSHGNYKEFAAIIKNIRTLSKKHNKNVAILQDLQGLKIRIGKLKHSPMTLKTGEEVFFTTDTDFNEKEVPVQYDGFINDVNVGQRVLVADGSVQLKVFHKKGNRVHLKVIRGGEIADHKGINIPDTSVCASPITEKDKQDIAFGIKQGMDYIALSFVKDRKDILELKHHIAVRGGKTKVIAKIERKEALDHLEEIINEADGVMVARGDLGVELSYEQVPLIQKHIIHLANSKGKPVITATQMLSSMINDAVPSRAEVSDIANAVLDHTHALMLSDETAVGKYPLQAVSVMDTTALEVEEKSIPHKHFWKEYERLGTITDVAISYYGIPLAHTVNAAYIVVYTVSGFTALQVACFRPPIPIIVFTLSEEVKRQLALVYGINDIHVLKTFEDKFLHTIPFLIRDRRLKKGDRIVTVSAGKKMKEGTMDEIRLFTVGN